MIPRECKRLAEVDFPIAVVSKHAAREKSIRFGHPSTLHLWWARRPLASCRAMLLALLLPDPCDPLCPEDFKGKARDLLAKLQGKPGPSDMSLRKALLKFIGDFANWDHSAEANWLEAGRGLVKSAHPEETPLVVDPFAGGGSIPLEALRLGCDAFASDLNPVACLILKVMLEDIPRHGPELADELRKVGTEVKSQAEKELADFYPKGPDGGTSIAYLWARTVRCEAPNCGAEIPLTRSFWLCKKANRKRALRHRVVRPRGETPRVELEVFEPVREGDVPDGTVARAKATCLCCGAVLPPERVRAQLTTYRGGADAIFNKQGRRIGGARILAVVAIKSDHSGRHYRLPTDRDYEAVWEAQKRVRRILGDWEKGGKKGLCPVPNEPTPSGGGSGAGRAFSVQKYGMMTFGDMFTARQKVALRTLCDMVGELQDASPATSRLLSFAFSRVAMSDMSCTRWNSVAEKMQHTFGRQALPIVWDFAEVVPIAEAPGNWQSGYELILDVVSMWPASQSSGQSQLADACESPVPSEGCALFFTDPPYYDAIPYSDLSDFFFVWLKRLVPGESLLRDPFDPKNGLTPKAREAVQDEARFVNGHPKDRMFFEERMSRAFAEGRRVLKDDGVGSVVFAHKTTEGWEALLSGMISGGWAITGSWPITTEMASRLRAMDSAALAASVHLVCRPRTEDATGDWDEVRRKLPGRVHEWMERLQKEKVRGADLVFACIGPALELYSRYAKVVDAEDREIPLGGDPEAKEPHKRGYLAYVWETVARAALEQVLGMREGKATNHAGGALEEDARLTALFLWTLQGTNGNGENGGSVSEQAEEGDTGEEAETPKKVKRGFSLIFDVARRFAQPLGIHLDEWEHRLIETEKGIVRLMSIDERAKVLFGEETAGAIAGRIEDAAKRNPQMMFDFITETDRAAVPTIKGGRRTKQAITDEDLRSDREATTLDRVHAAMLLQKGGRSNALRALLKAEQERGLDFLRLANSLSALYPKDSEEKRLLDAMLLAVPR